jgi:hypothetical protein
MSSKTLDAYITEVSADFFNFRKTSIIKNVDGFEVLASNVIEPYIDILKARAVTVTLSPSDVIRYRYKPRLLSTRLYATENLFYLILLLNDTTVENFVPNQVTLLNTSDRQLIEGIINKERSQGTII